MSKRQDDKLKKDLLVSVLGHLALVSLIVIVNPSAGMFHGTPEKLVVGTVDLGGGAGGGPKAAPKEVEEVKPEEAKSLVPPPMNEDVIEDAAVEEKMEPEMSEKLADIIPEKPQEKPKDPPKEEKKPEKKPEPKQQTNKVQQKKSTNEPKEKAPETVTQDGKTGVDVDASVAAGDGSGGGGTYNLPYNIGLLTSRISRAWRNPVSSAEAISCTIYFRIDANGQLMGEPSIERSSGIPVFDRAALRAIMRTGNFPRFPSGFDYEFIGLHLDFEYVP